MSEVLALADSLAPHLRDRFLRLVIDSGAALPLPLLRDLVVAGDVPGMWQLIADMVAAEAIRAGSDLEDLLLQGVTQGYVGDPVQMELSLQMVNPHAVAYAQSRGPVLAGDVAAPTMELIDQVVRRMTVDSVSPDRTATAIAQLVGPTPPHQEAIARFQTAAVRAGNPNWLNATARYRDRLVRYRARMIARTEAIAASTHGQIARWWDTMPHTSIVIWVVTPDDRLCKWCAPMDGQERTLEDLWSGDRERWFRSTVVGFPGGIVEAQRQRSAAIAAAAASPPDSPPLPGPGFGPDPWSTTGIRPIGRRIADEVSGAGLSPRPGGPATVQAPPLHPHCRCALVIRAVR